MRLAVSEVLHDRRIPFKFLTWPMPPEAPITTMLLSIRVFLESTASLPALTILT